MKKYIIMAIILLFAVTAFGENYPDGYKAHKWLTNKKQMTTLKQCEVFRDATIGCTSEEKWKGYNVRVLYLFHSESFIGVVISFRSLEGDSLKELSDKIINDFGTPIHFNDIYFFWNKNGTRVEWYYMKNEMYILHNDTIVRFLAKQKHE